MHSNFNIDKLPNGEELNFLPTGLQYGNKTKLLIGNGVVIEPKEILNDFTALSNNGIEFKERLFISNRLDFILIMSNVGLTL